MGKNDTSTFNGKFQKVECIKDFDLMFSKGETYRCGKELNCTNGAVKRFVYSDIYDESFAKMYPETPTSEHYVTQDFYIIQTTAYRERLEEYQGLIEKVKKMVEKNPNDDDVKDFLEATIDITPKPHLDFYEHFKFVE